MSESRAAARRKILKTGTIELGGDSRISCAVRNLSEKGAALEITSPLFIPDRFTLIVESENIRHRAQIAWRKNRRLGVTFIE